eukprot:TRINITY_DN5977_c0_g1_i1.p1 TRINITY_DN5977_c0_g1~~TRINITY_DN5977_c0_g1_i1.p1  ORF type:complete len:203 (-),score=6.92 TRINITY_DN5977_c0_g1_i1:100-642(-)
MHRYMIPITGFIFTFLIVGALSAIISNRRFLRSLNQICVCLGVIQMLIGLFYIFNPIWPVGYELWIVGTFSIYAALTQDKNTLKWFTIVSVFYTLAVWGMLVPFGYGPPLLEDDFKENSCVRYYTGTGSPDQCFSYYRYLQFLSVFLVYIQPFQAFFAYVMYREIDGQKAEEVPFATQQM